VITVVRVVRVLLILMLAALTISLVMALGTHNTGWIEKVALVILLAGCVYAAAKITTLSERFVHRLARH
jgi:glycine cleavage system regulatory protein